MKRAGFLKSTLIRVALRILKRDILMFRLERIMVNCLSMFVILRVRRGYGWNARFLRAICIVTLMVVFYKWLGRFPDELIELYRKDFNTLVEDLRNFLAFLVRKGIAT